MTTEDYFEHLRQPARRLHELLEHPAPGLVTWALAVAEEQRALADLWRHSHTIAADGKSITCHTCWRTSHNPNDVQERYCAHCSKFHES
jgi:hypothetical protein